MDSEHQENQDEAKIEIVIPENASIESDELDYKLIRFPQQIESELVGGDISTRIKNEYYFINNENGEVEKLVTEQVIVKDKIRTLLNMFNSKEEKIGTGKIDGKKLIITPSQVSPTN